jgi:hypothetical protein
MRAPIIAMTMVMLGVLPLSAQRPDSLRADSIARARAADSIRIVRELEAMAPRSTPGPRQAGASNPRLLPDISAVGDLIGDLSPKGSTQEDGSRFGVRELELALQAAVDPYFRADVFLGFSDAEGVHIEQAFLTATSLPWRLEARLGRFLAPFGKQNTTHRHDLHTVEHSYVVQRLLGEEGLKNTGVYLGRVFSPLGFYQELILTVSDRIGEAPEGLTAPEPANKKLSGLGYSARLRNYWDLSEAANLEVSASAMTGRKEQPLAFGIEDVNAALARQTTAGLDLTFRWRPLEQGLYRSFILQAEVMKQFNRGTVALPEPFEPADYRGPTRDFTGAYVFGRYQISRRTFIGGRYDWVQDPEADGVSLTAGSGVLEFFPSEFSKLIASVERRSLKGFGGTTRFLLQATFAIGPHKPHPF